MKRSRVIAPPGRLAPELCCAIEGSVSMGSGTITNIFVNDVLVKEEVKWERFCILDPLYGGLTCDGNLEVKFDVDDKWFVETMFTNGTTYNRADFERYKKAKGEKTTEASEDSQYQTKRLDLL